MDSTHSPKETIKTVLIVDDEEAFTQILSEGIGLYKGDLHVLTASNGRTAMEMLNTASIDCVVTDLDMPVMDGFELLKYIREKRPDTRVITLSWLGGSDVRRRLRSLGVKEMLEKPAAISTILNSIFASDGPLPQGTS